MKIVDNGNGSFSVYTEVANEPDILIFDATIHLKRKMDGLDIARFSTILETINQLME